MCNSTVVRPTPAEFETIAVVFFALSCIMGILAIYVLCFRLKLYYLQRNIWSSRTRKSSTKPKTPTVILGLACVQTLVLISFWGVGGGGRGKLSVSIILFYGFITLGFHMTGLYFELLLSIIASYKVKYTRPSRIYFRLLLWPYWLFFPVIVAIVVSQDHDESECMWLQNISDWIRFIMGIGMIPTIATGLFASKLGRSSVKILADNSHNSRSLHGTHVPESNKKLHRLMVQVRLLKNFLMIASCQCSIILLVFSTTTLLQLPWVTEVLILLFSMNATALNLMTFASDGHRTISRYRRMRSRSKGTNTAGTSVSEDNIKVVAVPQ